jgi:adenylate cyclase class 2
MRSRQEIEAKFHVSDLHEVRQRLMELGGHVATPSHHELNLYFDTPDRKLMSGHQVLRIRTDGRVRMTYKQQQETFEERTEIEISLDDAAEARALLEALGFETTFSYEKRREVFGLDGVLVMLDELPFGRFVEIEGPALKDIVDAAARLGFNWQTRVRANYLTLFERLRKHLGLSTHEATFATFNKLPPIRAEDTRLGENEQSRKPDEIAS